MAGINSFELEIHNLYQQGLSLDELSEELVSKYDKNEILSPAEIEGLCHFLTLNGRFDLLQNLFITCLRYSKISTFPIGHFVESFFIAHKSNPHIDSDFSVDLDHVPENFIHLCQAIISSQPKDKTSLQNDLLLRVSPLVKQSQSQYEITYSEERLKSKKRFIEQLNNFRNAGLFEQEESILGKLTRTFPEDSDINLLKQAQLEKKADEILGRVITSKNYTKLKSNRNPTEFEADFLQNISSHILKIAQDLKNSNNEQLYNLAILAYQFELFDICLKILDFAPQTSARDWLKAETLSAAERYIDLLQLLNEIEKIEAETSQPHTAFGIVYLRAIAYFGLGQKNMAIQLMQSLLHRAPEYRSAASLLAEWTTE